MATLGLEAPRHAEVAEPIAPKTLRSNIPRAGIWEAKNHPLMAVEEVTRCDKRPHMPPCSSSLGECSEHLDS